MDKRRRPAQIRRREKNKLPKVGDLVKIGREVPFLEPEMCGTVGLVVSFHETGYPKGLSGRSRDGIMYTVAALGKNVKLFEDEIEVLQ